MPKALCMTGIVISILVFILFMLDLLLGLTEATSFLAPFQGASKSLDLVFVLCAAGLGYLSWVTWREQE